MSAIFAIARPGEIDWAAFDCAGWFLYDFKDVAIISISEWLTKSLNRGLRGDSLPGISPKRCGLAIKLTVLT